jgi:hypothetical protein
LPSASAPAAATPSASASSAAAVLPAPKPAVPATYLAVTADTKGGGLGLVRGGPAQEFTVTLRNGNAHEYRHLLVAFQMEGLVPEPGDTPGTGADFVLERRDPATGAWRPAELRIANDHKPYGMYEGGAELARDAVRTEHYRLRATAAGPTGSSPLMVSVIDTDAPDDAPEAAARPGYVSLPHTTRRG